MARLCIFRSGASCSWVAWAHSIGVRLQHLCAAVSCSAFVLLHTRAAHVLLPACRCAVQYSISLHRPLAYGCTNGSSGGFTKESGWMACSARRHGNSWHRPRVAQPPDSAQRLLLVDITVVFKENRNAGGLLSPTRQRRDWLAGGQCPAENAVSGLSLLVVVDASSGYAQCMVLVGVQCSGAPKTAMESVECPCWWRCT